MTKAQTADWITQTRRGLLELCILGLIERDQTYGYEIVTRLAQAPSLAAGEGTVYPLLRRLRQEGWLKTYWQASEAGPPRQYYELTQSGKNYLSELRSQWKELVAAVNGAVDAAAPGKGETS